MVSFRDMALSWELVKLYVKIWCPWCVAAQAWLDREGYKYELLDVLADGAAYDRMRRISGQSLTPTLELDDGPVLPDFDVNQLEKFLVSHNIAPQ